MSEKKGILYAVTGEKYIREAERSAVTAKERGIRTAIFYSGGTVNKEIFDFTKKLKDPKGISIDKIRPMKHSPFEKTLFLDSDTLIVGEIKSVWEVLEKYDLAYVNAPVRKRREITLKSVPDAFAEPNTGVLFYKRDKCRRLLERWREQHKMHISKDRDIGDQPAFRYVLYNSKVKSLVLPYEYNIRTPFPIYIGGHTKPRILHGRGRSMNNALERLDGLDERFWPRVFENTEDTSRLAETLTIYKIMLILFSKAKKYVAG